MNIIDNQSWVYVHDYVVQNWLCIPILLSFEHMVARSSVKGFKKNLKDGFPIPWEFTMLFIEPILQCKHYHTWRWWIELKVWSQLSLKWHLEFPKLANVMETNGAKILKNVKIHCMFMLSPMGHVMSKYMTLLMKMAIDGPNNDKANLHWLVLTSFVMSKFY